MYYTGFLASTVLALTVSACTPAAPAPSTSPPAAVAPTAAAGGGISSSGLVGARKCGLGTGQKATGAPLTLGAIVTKQPGVDFSDVTSIANAYFKCVNDNGGINGRPINYIVAEEQTNPQQVAALAAKLIQDDKVLALVGSTSLIDCSVNHAFYEQNNFNVMVAGVPFECFSTPNISAVNMGPYYSSLGAAQYLARLGVKSLVTVSANVPGADQANSGPGKFARLNNIADKGVFLENPPISDASGVALKVVQAAGDGGGVVLDFSPPEGLKILQAAQQQGLIDKVKWAWSTPGNDASVAVALGPAWNGKIGINAELAALDSTGPDNTLYQQVSRQYAPSIALGSVGQMGFLMADAIVRTLLTLPADQLTQTGVNKAIRAIKNMQTDLLCKPYYFGDLQAHVSNSVDRTVVPMNGVMVEKEGCFEIASLPGDSIEAIRQAEVSQKLNQ